MLLPPISVAMATFNGAKYLAEQIESILSQSVPVYELIICDDQSTDDTPAILEKYQQKGLIRYFKNDERLGYIGNFKHAVSLCRPGNYIALSDQDDVWLPGKLEAAMRCMYTLDHETKPVMVYSDLILVDAGLNVLNPSFRNELGQDTYEHCLETLLFGGFVNGCTILMNPFMRDYFKTIPANSTVPHDSWITLIGYTFGQAAIVPQKHVLYRKHASNATDVTNHKRRNRFQRLQSQLLHSLRKNDLFEKEINAAKLFRAEFADLLSPEQLQLFEKFIGLSGRGFVVKKLALRYFFKGKWRKSI